MRGKVQLEHIRRDIPNTEWLADNMNREKERVSFHMGCRNHGFTGNETEPDFCFPLFTLSKLEIRPSAYICYICI